MRTSNQLKQLFDQMREAGDVLAHSDEAMIALGITDENGDLSEMGEMLVDETADNLGW